MFFITAMLLVAPSICQSESFTPKVVCLSDSEEFLGWLTKNECEKMKGFSPNIISKEIQKNNYSPK